MAIFTFLVGSGWVKFFIERNLRKRDNIVQETKQRANGLLESIKNEKPKFTYLRSYKDADAYRHFKYAIVKTITEFYTNPEKVASEFERILEDQNHTSGFKINLITQFLSSVEGIKNNVERKNLLDIFDAELTEDERFYFYHLIKYKEKDSQLLNKMSSVFYLDEEFKDFVFDELKRTKGNFHEFDDVKAKEKLTDLFEKLDENNG